MRVLHLITELSTGGAETMLYRLLSAMDRTSFESRVVALAEIGPVGDAIRDLGIPVTTLGMPRAVPSPAGLTRLWRLLRDFRPHVLQTWMYHADLLGTVASGAVRVPALVWNIRCSDMDLGRYRRLTRWVVRACVHLSPRPSAIVVNSEAGRRRHEEMGYRPRRWMFIPNGFDLDRFRPDVVARTLVRRELGLANETPLIGLVARFDPMKDHRTFLQAAARLYERRPDVHYLLCGRGVDSANSALENMVRDLGIGRVVHLLGERRDIPTMTASLDVATMSSAFGEGFPSVVGEAMACGVPCAVTDVGDAALIVGDTGRVVPPGDPRRLAEAMEDLLEIGPEGRRRLGEAARRRIADNFALPAIATRYEKLYEELTDTCAG